MQPRAAAAAEATREVLVFVLGAEEYGVDILKVQEIRGCEKVTTIPAAPAFLKGVVNLRGTIVPVVDLRTKFGLPVPADDSHAVVVVLRIASRVIGAVVDASFIAGLATQAGRMILILDIEKLLSSGELNLLREAATDSAAP